MGTHRSRLFQAVVVMGCALTPVAACKEAPAGPCDETTGACHEPDGGPDASDEHDGGWPPTK